jgi:predicted membrane metal-binding protein
LPIIRIIEGSGGGGSVKTIETTGRANLPGRVGSNLPYYYTTANLGRVPVVALGLGQLPVAGLPANLLALPLAGPPMLLGAVGALLAPAVPPAASLADRLADPFLVALLAVARWCAALPGGSVALHGPARLAPMAVVGLLVLLARRRRRGLAVGSRDGNHVGTRGGHARPR